MSKLKQACKIFAEHTGVAVLEGEEDVSVMRWLGAGALDSKQKQILSEIYETL